MSGTSLVSAIIIFLDAENFIQEAIESVLTQSYPNWELLLVDDGSKDLSTEIARFYTDRYPQRVRYLEHPSHQNRGKSASRNLGIGHAQGEYFAFLDADDVWLPDKLEEQVSIMGATPDAGMLYGSSLYWYSWTQKPQDKMRDSIPRLGIQPDTIINPPQLLPLLLRGKVAVPGICSILVRKSVIKEVGGFDEIFLYNKNMYEDQAFYSKVCLKFPIFVTDACWARYRQHPDASTAVIRRMGYGVKAREFFLGWLKNYLLEQGEHNIEVWQALQAELWRIHYPDFFPSSEGLQYLLRWGKKWILRLEERILPNSIRFLLWYPRRLR